MLIMIFLAVATIGSMQFAIGQETKTHPKNEECISGLSRIDVNDFFLVRNICDLPNGTEVFVSVDEIERNSLVRSGLGSIIETFPSIETFVLTRSSDIRVLLIGASAEVDGEIVYDIAGFTSYAVRAFGEYYWVRCNSRGMNCIIYVNALIDDEQRDYCGVVLSYKFVGKDASGVADFTETALIVSRDISEFGMNALELMCAAREHAQ